MAKVNSLFQDQEQQRATAWLKANPHATEEEAYDALYPYDSCGPPDPVPSIISAPGFDGRKS